jgi:hypothetical protein
MMLLHRISALCNRLVSVFIRTRPQAPNIDGGKYSQDQMEHGGQTGSRPGTQSELTETQAQEITATWNLLNPP